MGQWHTLYLDGTYLPEAHLQDDLKHFCQNRFKIRWRDISTYIDNQIRRGDIPTTMFVFKNYGKYVTVCKFKDKHDLMWARLRWYDYLIDDPDPKIISKPISR